MCLGWCLNGLLFSKKFGSSSNIPHVFLSLMCFHPHVVYGHHPHVFNGYNSNVGSRAKRPNVFLLLLLLPFSNTLSNTHTLNIFQVTSQNATLRTVHPHKLFYVYTNNFFVSTNFYASWHCIF